MLVSTHPGWFPTTGLSFCLGLVWEQGPFITWWSGKPMVILQGVPDISRVSDTCCTELDDQGLMELKIRERISLEGTSGCTLSNSSTHARIPTAVCPGPCPGTFWRPPKEGVSTTSGADSDVITLCKQTICNLGVNIYSRAEGLLPQNPTGNRFTPKCMTLATCSWRARLASAELPKARIRFVPYRCDWEDQANGCCTTSPVSKSLSLILSIFQNISNWAPLM